mmetsp:Transcript_5256/g.15222  ORF Transcript_5256/g.15222 Transcript_5256/m.15222 type:complete len:194 (-) Transcript_5256:539-1120(-)
MKKMNAKDRDVSICPSIATTPHNAVCTYVDTLTLRGMQNESMHKLIGGRSTETLGRHAAKKPTHRAIVTQHTNSDPFRRELVQGIEMDFEEPRKPAPPIKVRSRRSRVLQSLQLRRQRSCRYNADADGALLKMVARAAECASTQTRRNERTLRTRKQEHAGKNSLRSSYPLSLFFARITRWNECAQQSRVTHK